MALRDLLRPMAAASGNDVPLRVRLHDALEPPPMPNRYVAPKLRTIDAVAFALRGYRVVWTSPAPKTVFDLGSMAHIQAGFHSSVLVYVTRSGSRVELPTIIPGEAHRVASWAHGARTFGLRFALWQVKREVGWILQRRSMRRR